MSERKSELISDTDPPSRKSSETGVNRRISGQQVLTEDTDSFVIGERVYVDGVKCGRIQFIGDTQFGQGEWAGIVLDERMGSNDGSVSRVRYFQCDPGYGVFARLFRLTREPIEGADGVLDQMRKYGYEVIDFHADKERRSSRGSAERRSSERRSSERNHAERRSSERPSVTEHPGPRRFSEAVSPRGPVSSVSKKSSMSSISTRPARNSLINKTVHIDRDPEMTNLAAEARRLSMETRQRLNHHQPQH